MSNLPATVTVRIPDISASRSKAAKKGWKCWAKILTSVNTPANDGYAYQGDFIQVGAEIEARPGAVILHVDQSSNAGIGVVVASPSGKGWIDWQDTADSDGRKWCGPLAKVAREWLGLSAEESMRRIAVWILNESPEDRTARGKVPLTEASIAYYSELAGRDLPAAEVESDAVEQPASTQISADSPLNSWLANTRATAGFCVVGRIDGILDSDLSDADKLTNIRREIEALNRRREQSAAETTYEAAVAAFEQE